MVMASLLLASPSPSPLSIQSHTSFSSNSHLSFSQSQTLFSPLFTSFPSLSLSLSASATATTSSPSVYCGRGDRKTAKGKRFIHSFGNARPRNKNKGRGAPRIYAPPDTAKKQKLEDQELVEIELDESLFSD